MKAIAIAGIVLLVVLACVIDIRCSIAKDAGAATEIRRIRGEMAAGAKAVTLGPRIFRTETAGLAAIVAAMAFSHNLE